MVDALVADGLLHRTANPRHARSPRVALTARGVAIVERLDRIDARVLGAVSRSIPQADLSRAAATLRAIRTGFEIEPRWRAVLDGP